MIAPDLAARGGCDRAAVDEGVALLAVCGGYQLLGRGYRGRDGSWLPGAGALPARDGRRRHAHDRRRPARESTLAEASATTVAGFENHAGRTLLDDGAAPLGRVVAGYGNDGASGIEGCRVGSGDRDVPPRAAPAAQPVARRPGSSPGRSSTHGRRSGAARPAPRRARATQAHAVARGRARAAAAAWHGHGRPAARRGTRTGRRAASAGGSAGSAGAGRRRRARRARRGDGRARPRPSRRHRSSEPSSSPAKTTWTTCFDQRLRSGEIDSTIAIGPSSGISSPSPIPVSSASSRCSASISVSPPLTPPPGSSQCSRPRFSCRQSRIAPCQRRSAETRIRGSGRIAVPTSPSPRVAALALGELVHLDELDRRQLDDDELGDPHPRLDDERRSRGRC